MDWKTHTWRCIKTTKRGNTSSEKATDAGLDCRRILSSNKSSWEVWRPVEALHGEWVSERDSVLSGLFPCLFVPRSTLQCRHSQASHSQLRSTNKPVQPDKPATTRTLRHLFRTWQTEVHFSQTVPSEALQVDGLQMTQPMLMMPRISGRKFWMAWQKKMCLRLSSERKIWPSLLLQNW